MWKLWKALAIMTMLLDMHNWMSPNSIPHYVGLISFSQMQLSRLVGVWGEETMENYILTCTKMLSLTFDQHSSPKLFIPTCRCRRNLIPTVAYRHCCLLYFNLFMLISSINLFSYSAEHLLEAGTHWPHAVAVGEACLLIIGTLQHLHQHLLLQVIIMSHSMDQIVQPIASFLLVFFLLQFFVLYFPPLHPDHLPHPWTMNICRLQRSDKASKLEWR